MSQDWSPLGRCPECNEEIPPGMQLITYDKADGSTGRFADCPRCGTVVSPE